MSHFPLPLLWGLPLCVGSWAAAWVNDGGITLGAATVQSARPLRHAPIAQEENLLAPPPLRVLSASLLSDELLEGVLPWPRWAGVSYIIDWPSATNAYGKFPPHIRRTSGTAEDILAQQPDIVLVSSYNKAITNFQLTSAQVPVHIVRGTPRFKQLLQEWEKLGPLLGLEKEIGKRTKKARRTISAIEEDARTFDTQAQALLLQGMFSYGGESLQSDCLKMAGLKNVFVDKKWGTNPSVNVEHLLFLSPDIIFVAGDTKKLRKATFQDLPPGIPWSGVKAYQNKAVFVVPGPWMSSVSHHALLACQAYLDARVLLEKEETKTTP